MSAAAATLKELVARPLLRLRRSLGISGMIATVFLLLLVLVAALAPLIAPHDPLAVDPANALSGPSWRYPVGTDNLGRDILSRLIWGARASLLGPFVVIGLALVIGTPLALLSAWQRGWVDVVIGRFFDIVFAFPGILLAVLTVALFGSGFLQCAIALSISYMPWLARVTRGAGLRERGKAYIAAGEVQGLSGLALCARHIVPNISALMVAQATVSFGYAFVDLAALSFLGFGAQPPAANWGLMVNSQTAILEGHPEQAVFSGVLIVACVMAVTIIGQRLSEGTERSRHRASAVAASPS